MKTNPRFRPGPYELTILSLALFVVFALAMQSPLDILRGLGRIFTARSLLTTDFIAVGGLGAALINAVITGLVCIGFMVLCGAKANGALTMAIWLDIGFSFFGKTVVNMLPLIAGVWLYARFQKEPFINYSLAALLSSTLGPVISEFLFTGRTPHPALDALVGLLLGLFVGFILPVVSSTTNRVHGGYNLYNVGFAGGIIAMFLVALGESMNIIIVRPSIISAGNNLVLALLLYSVFALWIVFGLVLAPTHKSIQNYRQIHTHSGRLVTDYYLLFKESAYINMGVMGVLGTTVTLLLGADLNGLTLAGIFTMMGFGAFGKHVRNCVPVMAGAVLFALLNHAPLTEPVNILAILFCTGLAPISGQYGWFWGVIAGVMHTSVVGHVGKLANGLNLYNNGFAAGFVALVLVPIILAFRRGKKQQ